jgi:hypothetical protein
VACDGLNGSEARALPLRPRGPGSNPHKVSNFCEVRGHGHDHDDDDDDERSSKNVYLQY